MTFALWLPKIPEKIFAFTFFTSSIAKTGEYVAPVFGRPKTVNYNVIIYETITQLVMARSSADSCWRTKVINTCKSLDNLKELRNHDKKLFSCPPQK